MFRSRSLRLSLRLRVSRWGTRTRTSTRRGDLAERLAHRTIGLVLVVLCPAGALFGNQTLEVPAYQY